MSQFPGPSQAHQWDMAEFFMGLASFLGLPLGQQHVPLLTMLFELVSQKVQCRLDSNPTSLPVPTSSPAYGAVECVTYPFLVSAQGSHSKLMCRWGVAGGRRGLC